MIRTTLVVLAMTVIIPTWAYCQLRTYVQLSSDRVIHYVITDPLGRRTGCDPRGAADRLLGRYIEEIPGANYSVNAIGDAPVDNQPLESDISHEFVYTIRSPENDGNYAIECIGINTGRYGLSTLFSPHEEAHMKSFDTTLVGLIDQDSVVTYRFEFRGSAGVFVPPVKQVSFSVLRNDIRIAFTLDLLGDEHLRDKLLSGVDKCEKRLGKKKEDSADVRRDLEKLADDLSKERQETAKHEERKQKEKRFISKDAFEILTQDVALLLKQFP